jgi:ABC-type Fe3+/spermidine/putrescine transport system ATPase subunit
MKPEIKFFDVETQEEIVREMNDEEYAQYLADKNIWDAQAAERLAEQAEIDAAKAAVHEKLSELGITPELIEVIKKL